MKVQKNSTLNRLEKELSLLSRDVHNEEIIANHLDYVKELAKNSVPLQMINEILSDGELLETIASRSYEHVNHFDKIVLIDNPDPAGFRLTLHSWNCNYGKEIPDEELIHNHRFSFWSHIFCGNLSAENFLESDSFSVEKKTFNRFIYRPSKTGNIHSCNFDTKIQLNKIKSNYQKEGDTYYLKFDTIHRILLPKAGNNLCTFVLRGPREREYTNTYNTFYPERGTKSSVPMMTPNKLKRKLENILGEVI